MHVVGYHDWCGRSSVQPWVTITNLAGYHDVCGGSHWLRLMFLIFFSWTDHCTYWASTMRIVIKHHCTEQQSYAIMVTHHMHYDNPPLCHIHFMELPGFKIYSQWTPSKSANTASECYNGGNIFATQSFRISVDSKKKWLKRDLWSN